MQNQPLDLIGGAAKNIGVGDHHFWPMFEHSLQRFGGISRLGDDL